MFQLLRFSTALAAIGSVVAVPTPQSVGGSTTTLEGMCGDNNYDILRGTPWIVDNLVYNADQMVGTQCTYFDSVQTPAGQNEQIVWSSVANIEYVEST